MTSILTIIIPFFNARDTIARTIDSLNKQKPDNEYCFEVVVIDDGSAEEFPETTFLLSNFRYRIFSTPNRGALHARCFGIKQAQTPFVYFLDADDELASTFFEDFCTCYRAGKFDVCLVDFVVQKDTLIQKAIGLPREPNELFYVRQLAGFGTLGYASTHIFRRDMFTPEAQKQIEECKYKYSEDLFFWLSIFRPNSLYVSLNHPAYLYYPSAHSSSAATRGCTIRDIVGVLNARYLFIKQNGPRLGYTAEEFCEDVFHQICYLRKLIAFRVKKGERNDSLRAFYSIEFLPALLQKTYPRARIKDKMFLMLMRFERHHWLAAGEEKK